MRKLWSFTLAFLACTSLFLASCRSGNQSAAQSEELANSSMVYETSREDTLPLQQMKDGLPVFYNMYLSVDMARLFENSGEVYNPDILNPVENEKNYVTSSKKALNLGVYAVDLGYIRAYEQYEKTRSYFDAMRNLSSSLGIPEDFFLKSSERYDNNITNKDSLVVIANEVYSKTTGFLKENERESSSALIVIGGWIEAVYIASQMLTYTEKDRELFEKIADQKTSIVSLLDMAGKYRDDKDIAGMCSRLEDLKNSFDKISVDPANLKASFPAMKELTGKITKIRSFAIR